MTARVTEPREGSGRRITRRPGLVLGLGALTAMMLSVGSAAAAGPRDRKTGGSRDFRADLARRFARVRQLAASGPVSKAESAAARLAGLIRGKLGSGVHPYLAAVRLQARILSRGKKAVHMEKAKKLYREIYRLRRDIQIVEVGASDTLDILRADGISMLVLCSRRSFLHGSALLNSMEYLSPSYYNTVPFSGRKLTAVYRIE